MPQARPQTSNPKVRSVASMSIAIKGSSSTINARWTISGLPFWQCRFYQRLGAFFVPIFFDLVSLGACCNERMELG